MPIKNSNTLSILHSFKSSFSSISSPSFHSSTSSSPKCPSTPHKSPSTPPHPHHTLSQSMMEDNIATAESVIAKHAADPTPFYGDHQEGRDFLTAIKKLQESMLFFVSESSSNSSSHNNLVRAQTLMQTAMDRLGREFYHIMSVNRDNLDPDSISGRLSIRSIGSDYDYSDTGSDEDSLTTRESIQQNERLSSPAMLDVQSIAECMISSGYGKECLKIYKTLRKSIIDEGLHTLGFERLGPHQIHKLNWDIAEPKIKIWLNSSKIAVKTLFSGERILCDHVFAASGAIEETCFAEIVKDAAVDLFAFPESVATKCKKLPEKIFPILDLCDTLSELIPDIESIFSCESTSTVRSQAATAVAKLGDVVRTMIRDFESALQKDNCRLPVPGGGIHPLTHNVMNYVCALVDYSGTLVEVYSNQPLPVQSPLPELLIENSPTAEDPLSSITVLFAWLILVLLCKLDGKAELYKDVGLSYLFLANNLHYIVTKIRSSNLRYVLGNDWISKHDAKLHLYVASYENTTWGKAVASLQEDPTVVIERDAAMEVFQRFNHAFWAVYRAQTEWVVPDGSMREEMKASVKKKILTAYRAFYWKYRFLVGHEKDTDIIVPDHLETYLSELFYSSSLSGPGCNGYSRD
ncbi:exocyst complex component EXO70H1-like [Magnolia sinica]|uniref:exocyst complex component EXO70H1-like n=1 Tax=Magnolia sinica TaxID=86752 RepID=UPI002659E48C|nr:exocyst complex component EXO70H1-like [Magnolia sinica]